jgi:tetratricopeptide (TPR) repeat protein
MDEHERTESPSRIRHPVNDRIQQLHSLLKSEPEDPFCLYGLAMEHAKRGEHDQAIAWFDKTLAVDPGYLYAYFHKAKSQEQIEDLTAAQCTLKAGLAKAKASGDAKSMNEIASYLDELE